jgi:hypothetical protein
VTLSFAELEPVISKKQEYLKKVYVVFCYQFLLIYTRYNPHGLFIFNIRCYLELVTMNSQFPTEQEAPAPLKFTDCRKTFIIKERGPSKKLLTLSLVHAATSTQSKSLKPRIEMHGPINNSQPVVILSLILS